MNQQEENINPLAIELAETLHDMKSIVFYQDCVENHPETFLRKTLKYVLSVPERKITTSRAAYFNFLVQQHAKGQKHYPGY